MKNSVHIENRKVRHDYFIEDTYTCGIMLTGPEVKMIRQGKMSFPDSFCYFKNGELFLKNSQIQGIGNDNIGRERKLLLKKKELQKLESNLIKGYSILPYKVFTNGTGLIKIEIVLAKGKKLYDKRESIKERDLDREMKKQF